MSQASDSALRGNAADADVAALQEVLERLRREAGNPRAVRAAVAVEALIRQASEMPARAARLATLLRAR